MTTVEQVKGKLRECHEQERAYGLEIGKNRKTMELLRKRNLKLARMISKNMLYRNQLIEELHELQDN